MSSTHAESDCGKALGRSLDNAIPWRKKAAVLN